MFNREYFKTLFKKYPLLQRFLTEGIQISTDNNSVHSGLNDWQKELYAFLSEKYKTQADVRFYELERTLLSILFIEALKKGWSLATITAKNIGLTENDIENFKKLAAEVGIEIGQDSKTYQLLIISIIIGDIGKIDQVRSYFRRYGLTSSDQDIALGYILKLDKEILVDYLQLSLATVDHLKTFSFPLHLGHAAQAECTPAKFIETREFLAKSDNKTAKKCIHYAILKQVLDVAGARAQTGDLLLNSAILKIYLQLRDVLLELVNPNVDPTATYWQYITLSLTGIDFKDPVLDINPQTQFRDVDTYSKKGLTWRLCRLLRIIERPTSSQEALEIENTVEQLLNDPTYVPILEKLRRYERRALHTFTYFPAILATLREQAAQSKNEYAIKVGLKLLNVALSEYFAGAHQDRSLLQSPLCFNQLNGVLKNNPLLAGEIIKGNKLLKINIDGNLQIIPNHPLVIVPNNNKKAEEKKYREGEVKGYNYFFNNFTASPLENILLSYGLSGESQCLLMKLLYYAGAFSVERLELDLNSVGADGNEIRLAKDIVSRIDPRNFSADMLLNRLFATSPYITREINIWPKTAHLWWLRVTQWALFARENNQERWEMINLDWMEKFDTEVREFINSIGILKGEEPVNKRSAGTILGASYYEMARRIEFAKLHQNKMGKIYLLTGDRDVTPMIDGERNIGQVKQFFAEVSSKTFETFFKHLPDAKLAASNFLQSQRQRLTEAGLMIYLVYLNNLPCYLVNTLKPSGAKRPTTINTVEQWIKDVEIPPRARDILVISSAPYLKSQEVDVNSAFVNYRDWHNITVEIAGPSAISTTEFRNLYPNLELHMYNRKVLESVGGYFFGAFSEVASKLGYIGKPSELNELRVAQSFTKQKEQAQANLENSTANEITLSL